MFDTLKDKLTNSLNKLRGLGRLTDENIKSTVREIRTALLEADVALPVANEFIEQIRTSALGQKVIGNVRPGDALVKVVHDELVRLLGSSQTEINFKTKPPVIILVAGLQGSGKTTTVAKLARWLGEYEKKSVLVTSADIYRPAAIEQLKILAQQIETQYFPSEKTQNPVEIAKSAVAFAKNQFIDVVIIDTAGRLHIDTEMMQEVSAISQAISPTETLLVVDSMLGQDAVNTAKAFNEALPLTGIILTKTDGDARGGAALSMRMITGKPIKFVGVGEKVDAFEPFHPDRVASRILGMGDIISLVEEAHHKVDKKQAEKLAKKLKQGKRFDFNDFLSQLKQMQNMGGMKSFMSKLPGMPQIPKAATKLVDDKAISKMEALILSMTLRERQFPAFINGSRKRRIAAGSGTSIQDINNLLKQFVKMQKMLKNVSGDKMLKKLKKMQDRLPPELLNQLPPDLFGKS